MIKADDRSYAAYLLILIAAMSAWLLWLAFLDPGTGFLPPHFQGMWLLAPHAGESPALSHFHEALFERNFGCPCLPAAVQAADAEVCAGENCELYVNGNEANADQKRFFFDTWKISNRYSIKHLLVSGSNRITVLVRSSNRTPVIWLEAIIRCGDGTQAVLHSDKSWRVSVDGGRTWTPPELPGAPRNFYKGHLSFFLNHRRSFWALRWLSLALVVLCALAVFKRRRASPPARPRSEEDPHRAAIGRSRE